MDNSVVEMFPTFAPDFDKVLWMLDSNQISFWL